MKKGKITQAVSKKLENTLSYVLLRQTAAIMVRKMLPLAWIMQVGSRASKFVKKFCEQFRLLRQSQLEQIRLNYEQRVAVRAETIYILG